MRHLREGLKYDPEHKGCKDLWRKVKKLTKITKKADDALAAKNYEDAATMSVPPPRMPVTAWPL